MATPILISTAIFFTAMLLSSAAIVATGAHDLGFHLPAAATCSGSIEECMISSGDGDSEEDFDIAGEGLPEDMDDGEISRRVLYWRRWSKRYISYGALLRDRVPCSRRGYSYYNCRPGTPVNPYTRGCSAITLCRG